MQGTQCSCRREWAALDGMWEMLARVHQGLGDGGGRLLWGGCQARSIKGWGDIEEPEVRWEWRKGDTGELRRPPRIPSDSPLSAGQVRRHT